MPATVKPAQGPATSRPTHWAPRALLQTQAVESGHATTTYRLARRLVECKSDFLVIGLYYDSLDLVQADFIIRPVIEFGCSRRFMRCNLLRMLDSPAVPQILGNARRPEGVTSDLR
jgi:hypothetical protein